MKKDIAKLTVGSLLILGWVVAQFIPNRPSPASDTARQNALGEVIAEECLKLLTRGGSVTLVSRDTHTFRNPSIDEHRRAVTAKLRSAGVTSLRTNLLKSDVLGVPSVAGPDFFRLLTAGREGDVVVSLYGPPTLTDAQIARLPPKRPAVLVLGTGAIPRVHDLDGLLRRGVIQAVVVDKPGIVGRPPENGGMRLLFDHWYEIRGTAPPGGAPAGTEPPTS